MILVNIKRAKFEFDVLLLSLIVPKRKTNLEEELCECNELLIDCIAIATVRANSSYKHIILKNHNRK